MEENVPAILDASAWIEFFYGSNPMRGVIAEGNCYTCITTMAELSNYAAKISEESSPVLERVEKLSSIIYLTKGLAELAGRLNFERKKANKDWGMMDSFVLAASRLYGLKILTKDNDFKDLENVEML